MSVKQETQEAQLLLGKLLFGKQMTYCLSGVARLGVADHMNATPMAVEEIAGKTGAHAPSLYRVMRMLASMGVFKEEQDKRFALTPAGELLKSDTPGTMRYFAMMFGDEWTTRAYEHFMDCLRTGQDGVSKAYGQHVFDVLAERPEQSDTFQAAMTSSSTMDGKAVTGAYDFSGIKRLADVGGGHGALLASILRRYPQMQGVLFDRAEIIAGVAKDQFAGCEGRITIEGGSFFERMPDGCNAYIMKHIIHDWDDERASQILQNCHRAMQPGGKVLIVDAVIPPGNRAHFGKLLDLEMLVLTPRGRERTQAEFRELLKRSGFRLRRVVSTETHLSVVEGVRA
jgi:SAM-dependent methyltransferase